MAKKKLKCKNCGKELTGRQKKFCSLKCSRKSNNAGRKLKLTPEMKEDIRKKLELGLNYKDVCMGVGISEQTFSRWRQENQEFSELVDRANAKVKEISLASVRRGEIRDWRAAAWRLERRFPDEYKDKKELEVTDKRPMVSLDGIFGETNDNEDGK